MPASVLGLDIGGANLKAAHTCGVSRTVPFALWRHSAGLSDALRELIAPLPAHDRLAVTMTGELCDCFPSKRAGVLAILDAVTAVAGSCSVCVWTNQGTFVDLLQARPLALSVASANWLALATFAGRFAPSGPALLLDIGTTTTDIIPLTDGQPVPTGRTDPERLHSGELLYAGWKRTPACALLGPSHAAEFFATMHDVYLVLGQVPEEPESCDTADGQPATRSAAYRRLARMMLADLETCTVHECEELARELNRQLLTRIASAIDRLCQSRRLEPQTLLVSGSGEFLLPILPSNKIKHCQIVSLAKHFGPAVSTAACAHAVANLCVEREG